MAINIFPQPLCSGDIYPLKLTFTQSSGAAYDLTGSHVGGTVKLTPNDDPDVQQSVWMQSVAGDTTGVIQFYIGPLDEGDYWLDIKMWNSTNVRSTVLAPVQMHVIQSVTARTVP